MDAPRYKAVKPSSGSVQRMIVKPEVSLLQVLVLIIIIESSSFVPSQTAQVRPYGLAAVLRNVTFTKVCTVHCV